MPDNETTELAIAQPATPTPITPEQVFALAANVAGSSFAVPKQFRGRTDEETRANVVAVMFAGVELGLLPMLSLRHMDLVDGEVRLNATGQLALAMRNGVGAVWNVTTPKVAELILKRPGRPPHTARYTLEDAKVAGLLGKTNWKRYPADMLQKRAITRGIRAYCPDLVSGVYDRDEIEEMEDIEIPQNVRDVWEAQDAQAAGQDRDTLNAELSGRGWSADDVHAFMQTKRPNAKHPAAMNRDEQALLLLWLDKPATQQAAEKWAAGRMVHGA